MNRIWIVAQKEISQITRNRATLATSFLFILIFGGLSVPAALVRDGIGLSLDQLGFFILLMLGIFMGYVFSAQVFLREKQTGVIETVLCTPLSLRQIWLGKVLGVAIFAYGTTLLAADIIFGGAYLFSNGTVALSAPMIANLFSAVPAFIVAAVGLLGFSQLMLGMRENQFLNMGLIFLLVFLITGAQELIGPEFQGSWTLVAVLTGIAVFLLLIMHVLTKFLSKERIVLTIP